MEAAVLIIAILIAAIVCAFSWWIECYKAAVVLPLVIVLLGAWFGHTEYGTVQRVTFTVNSLDDQGGSSHKYLVFATDPDGRAVEYEDTDAWFHGKTDSSDVWAAFLSAGTGARWSCTVYGYRIRWQSSYQDILDGCTLLSKGHPAQVTGG